MDPRRLYREIVDVEKQLRELLRSNPLNAQDANVLRSRLMEKARILTQVSPTFAAARELEQVLWKPCFYKRIEDFRRRIRKYASAPSTDRTVREHFARVSNEFQEFLTDASAFYENLRESLTRWLLQNRVSRIAASGPSSAAASEAGANIDKCRQSLHRCLVFLGDLARYRELHGQKAKKNFAAAENFYNKALAVIPENGNPHNQLAVLATYVEAETVAVYRYCRSLLIAQPFVTAEENLALLFERARQRPLAPPSSAIVTASSASKDKSAYLKSFLHRLTRMHGIIFSIATRHATNGAGNSSSGASPPNTGPRPVYSKEMEALLMKDLGSLLAAGVVGDALLLKLVVTNIFCIVRSRGTPSSDDALRLATRMMSVVTEWLVVELNKLDEKKKTPKSAASPQWPTSLRLLSAVATYTDFLRFNTAVLEEMDAILSRMGDETSKRFVTDFLERIAMLLNHAKVQSVVSKVADEKIRKEQVQQLKETTELRGFKPLSALLDEGNAAKWRDDLAVNSNSPNQPSGLSDQDAWTVRAWKILCFGNFLCQEYEGNPLLYSYKGQFSTSPSVVSSMSNGFSLAQTTQTQNATAPVSSTPPPPPVSNPLTSSAIPPSFDFGFFQSQGTAPTNGNGSALSADDFDDEVIVYQPSPSLTPAQPRGEGSSALGGSANSVLGFSGMPSPFTSDFSLGGSSNPFAAAQVQEKRRAFSSDAAFASFGTNGNSSRASAIGSSLGYPSFNTFSGLGASNQDSFSGWGNTSTAPASKPSAAPSAPPALNIPPLPPARANGSAPFGGSMFGDMNDLDAIERATSMYEQRESSLSAFFSTPSATPPRAGSVPSSPFRTPPQAQRASTTGSRPPPGFAPPASAPFSGLNEGHQQPQPSFFTRNPFVNP
ncbi:hypothetical protein Poli38472_011825 [Pythium oligandrum]|uniref:Telomerase activating protein Est1 n=1 Tax=Pythium oligandrum TaxID=41045 RepID=A0A8K1C7Y5_PYTOL|nr:hypothetical protein Poli38472_011825 [Pythium oligandrum]|eukprot:TMW58237.1 hypothetical protein Poli38472_011825 [Pythium oligandrum]